MINTIIGKRIITELWEVEGILYIMLALQLDGFWHYLFLVWGIFNLVASIIYQLKNRVFKYEGGK